MKVQRYGEHALLVECASLDEVVACAHTVRDARLPGVVDVVPAARTVLITVATVDRAALDALLGGPMTAPPVDGQAITIHVRYDGEDLGAVAAATGLTVEEVVELHSGGEHVAAFSGFASGFAYLTGLDSRLHLPRRSTPRTRVPAGAVAMAGEFSAVYPTASPGGWHLLGHTDAVLFDVDREPAALIAPGARVRFAAR